jgi:hypothetical protein
VILLLLLIASLTSIDKSEIVAVVNSQQNILLAQAYWENARQAELIKHKGVVEDALRTELDDKRDIILECDTTFAAKVEQFKAFEGEHAQLLNGGAAKKGFEDARDHIQNMSARMAQMQ